MEGLRREQGWEGIGATGGCVSGVSRGKAPKGRRTFAWPVGRPEERAGRTLWMSAEEEPGRSMTRVIPLRHEDSHFTSGPAV